MKGPPLQNKGHCFPEKTHYCSSSFPPTLIPFAKSFLPLSAGSDGKESACNIGDLGSIPGSGRSPREGNGNPLQYSCLENPMDTGAWRAAVLGVARSQT